MRIVTALMLTASPALAHPAGAHLHERDGFFVAAIAFVIAATLSLRAGIKHAKATR